MTLPIPDVPPASATTVLCSPWAQPSDVPESVRSQATNGQWAQVLLYASEVLYQLSGCRWRGVGCADSVVVRSRPAAIGSGVWPMVSYGVCGCWVYDGAGSAWSWSSWGYAPGCREFAHPRPGSVMVDPDATAIIAVTDAGGVVDPAGYRLSESGWVQRVDGAGWAVCGPDGPTTIEYLLGVAPPVSGVMACVRFAVELFKAWSKDPSCAIPERATATTRQGVSMTFDPDTYLSKRRTGVASVDQWLVTVNPKGRARGGSVWSPDLPTGAHP